MTNPLTTAEQDQLASLLNRATWPLPPDVFHAALGLIPTVAIELVVFDDNSDILRVVLLPRPEEDPYYKGLVHGPGTVMRLGDTEEKALERAAREIGPDSISGPRFAGVVHVPKGPLPMGSPRGQEIGLVYYSFLHEGARLPEHVMLAGVRRLPKNIIGFHREIIAMAVEKRYEHHKTM